MITCNADVNVQDYCNPTLLYLAAVNGEEDVALALINEFGCDINIRVMYGRTILHIACRGGCVALVRSLIRDHNADVNAQDENNNTPLHEAAKHENEDVVLVLINEFGCDTNLRGRDGRTVIHYACRGGCVALVRTLIRDHNADVNVQDEYNNTPLHVAAGHGKEGVVLALINEFGCDTNIRGRDGRTLLHSASAGGCVALVRTLIRDHNGDVNAQDKENNTPLHVAAQYGAEVVTSSLITTFGCDTHARNSRGWTFVHTACYNGRANIIVKSAGTCISPLVLDNNGNTPLHLASEYSNNHSTRNGRIECVEALLLLNAPIMLRNASGKTSRDLATGEIKSLLDTYIKENNSKMFVRYDTLQEHAKKKYSTAEPITRLFVIGNPGAGKSSFVETMKREGFFQFGKVSESSVPLHTAGIVPSIYVSKHYGRVLFYDLQGIPSITPLMLPYSRTLLLLVKEITYLSLLST